MALERTHLSWNRLHRAGNALAYTRKVMYHLQVAWWRRRRVTEVSSTAVDYAEPPVPEDTADATVQRLVLQEALSRLTARQRAVVVLRFYEDRSVEEAAETLGCSTGTVKSQTAKAIAALRRQRLELWRITEREPR